MKFAIEDLKSSARLINTEVFTKAKCLASKKTKKSLDILVFNILFSGIGSETEMRQIRELRIETYDKVIFSIDRINAGSVVKKM